MHIKKWTVSPLNKENAAKIAEEFSFPFFLAMMLDIRGIRTKEQVQEFMGNEQEFFDPYRLTDMEKAVGRIHKAIDDFEKIAIYGDYDADGVTATAMLYSYLESCGANVMFYIPEREGEGYGLNMAAIQMLQEQEINLIITVDNGIASVEEVAYAENVGIDVIITDHHRPQKTLPAAFAVIDPYRPDCDYPFKELAGVGVAFKLIAALEGENLDLQGLIENYADLVAIGTIGDVVPLLHENRLLVKEGLKQLSRSDRLGIENILEQANFSGRKLTALNVAFTIVPRINATGRIGSSSRAVRLLCSENDQEALSLAEEICAENEQRKKIENEIYESAWNYLTQNPQELYHRVLVICGKDWHHGVIGIVASRLTEKFGKPCIVCSDDGNEIRGSGRSIEGFPLFQAVCACSQYLTKFGGHPMAAGLSMPPENLEDFRRTINAYAAENFPEMPVPVVRLECKLNPAALSVEMAKYISFLEPFGTGNPSPVFGLYGMELKQIVPVGEGKHLRLVFGRDGTEIRCMKFRTTPEECPYAPGDKLDLAVTLEAKEFRGEVSLSLQIKDWKLSGMDVDHLVSQYQCYEKYHRQEQLSEQEADWLSPTREDFAAVYRFLRMKNGWHQSAILLLARLQTDTIGLAKLLVILEVLQEHRLINYDRNGETVQVALCKTEGKVDLFQSEILQKINNLRAVR